MQKKRGRENKHKNFTIPSNSSALIPKCEWIYVFCHRIIDFTGIFGHTYHMPNDVRYRLLFWNHQLTRLSFEDCIFWCMKEIKFFEAPPKLNQSTVCGTNTKFKGKRANETIHRILFLLFSFTLSRYTSTQYFGRWFIWRSFINACVHVLSEVLSMLT